LYNVHELEINWRLRISQLRMNIFVPLLLVNYEYAFPRDAERAVIVDAICEGKDTN